MTKYPDCVPADFRDLINFPWSIIYLFPKCHDQISDKKTNTGQNIKHGKLPKR